MAHKQLSLFDIPEVKTDHENFTLPDMWSLSRLCDKYYQFKKADGCSASFLNSARRHLRSFTGFLKRYGFDPDSEKLSDMNSSILSDYRQSLADNTKIGRVTANIYIAHIRMLFFWAEEIHGLPAGPMGAIRKFKKSRSAKKGHGRVQNRDAISWDHLERLFAAAGVVDMTLLLLGLNCGFGNTDIATLKFSDVDLEKAVVSHARSKTGAIRQLVLWPETVEVLKVYIKDHRGRPADEKFDRLIFINKKGYPMCREWFGEDGKFRRSDAIKNRFVRLYERAGLQRPYGRGFYALRHTAATVAGLGSNDLRQIQAFLGHRDISMQNVYRHDLGDKAKQAAAHIHDRLKKTTISSMVYMKCPPPK